MAKKIVSVLLVVCMMFSLTACSLIDSMKVKSLLGDFQEACNLTDINTALTYIDPNVADKIKLAADIVGMFTNKTDEELFLDLAALLTRESFNDVNFFTTLNIDVQEVIVAEDGASAIAKTIVTYDLLGEQNIKEAEFSCIYYAEQWYISSFTFV